MDESTVPQPAQEPVQPETPVEQPVVPPVEEQPPQETPPTPSTQEPQQPEPEAPKFKIKRNGEEIELTQDELIQEAEKGYDYTRKTQELSEVRKAQEWKINTFDALSQNPAMMKIAMATQLGYDPSIVVSNPQPPPQELAETNPLEYGRLQAIYENDARNKQIVDNAVNSYISKTVADNNNATLNLVAIENTLSDQQKAEVAMFVQNNVKATGTGMYSKQQIEFAVNALYGKQKQKEQVLNTANQVRTNLKKVATAAPAVSQKQQPPPSDPRLAEAQKLVKLAEELYVEKK